MAKTIKIFLIDGEPNGLKTAELSNWVGQAIVIPRNKLKEIKQRPECNKPAAYFLVGKESEEALLPTAYIGKAENLWSRLSTHDSSKDFWQTAVAFVSKDNNLTKVHVRYLESRCLALATQAKRFNLENSTESSLPSLSEADIAEMEEFLLNLKLLLSAIGYPILQEVISKEQNNISDPLFTCKGKDALATGRMTNDGFVVYKDSTATADISKAVIERNQKVIEKLLINKYLEKRNNGLYLFIKDYVFNSPSAASDIILGNSTSGWKKRIVMFQLIGTAGGPCMFVCGILLIARWGWHRELFDLFLAATAVTLSLVLVCLSWLKGAQRAQFNAGG